MNTEKQLTLIEPASQSNVAITPMQMLGIAIEKGATVEQLERLMALQERWQANEARKAYVEAKAAFYKEAPQLIKNKHVGFTSKRTGDGTDYWHVTLDYAVETLAPILAKHGFTHSWQTTQSEAGIEVSCILTHVMGHSERVSLKAGAEMSGTKNAIQGIGSTVTYLERYTFLAVTGMAAKGQDTDGRTGADFVTTEQADILQELAESVGADKERFFKYIGAESFATIPVKKFEMAKAALNRKAAK